MQNVQKREALPLRTTYSSTHRSRLGYGVGEVYIPKSPVFDIFFFLSGGVCALAVFQARVTRALSALWGWGPPFPWTPINPLTGTWRVRLKVGGGGPGVTGAWLIM